MKRKTRKQRQAEQLGMPIGTAKSKLNRKIIWDLLVSGGGNVCEYCDDWIAHPEALAITHVEPWLDNDPDLFWDTQNVAFMHPQCAEESAAERDAARRQKAKQTMNELVTLGILNERGEWLPGCVHDGKIYVAGKHGERYKLLLRNRTSERVEVVLTVDGRDVITGEEGSRLHRGYVLHPRETCEIEGWRTSDETVAAFRFGADKDKAYSTQKGTGAHLGIIGMVVYQERQHMLLRSMDSGIAPAGLGATYSSHTSTTITMDSWVDTQTGLITRNVERPRQEPRAEVKLGTKFGEEVHSHVAHTSFTRRHTSPDQTVTVEYDTFKNLKRRGIPIKRSKPRKESPSAFPADDNRYCEAPPRR